MNIKFFIISSFSFLLFACKNEVTPCSCAENLRNINANYDQELDEACDKYLDQLNELEAKKWMDEMMNCKSHYK